MALWIANPQNLLQVDSVAQLPLMNGWWGRSTLTTGLNIVPGPTLFPSVVGSSTVDTSTFNLGYLQNNLLASDFLLPGDGPFPLFSSDSLLAGEGLLPSDSLFVGHGGHIGRAGNGDGTITLAGATGLSSHQVSLSDVFPLGYAVTPGTELTFSFSAIGTVDSLLASVCSIAIVWINSANLEISRNTRSLRCPFGQKLRIATTGVAPIDSVRCLLQITASQTCIISHAALVLGDMVLANNDINYLQENELFLPFISGDHWSATDPNIMPVDASTGGAARMYDWRDSSSNLLTPTSAILTIPAFTTYVFNYQETTATTTSAGVVIEPNADYIFSITETGTTPTILLKFYDITGTVLIETLTMPVLTSIRRVISFRSPANAATLVISATTGESSVTLSFPTLIAGIPAPSLSIQTSLTNLTTEQHLTGSGDGDPGPLPPVFLGTFSVALDVSGSNRQLFTDQLGVASSNRALFDSALDVASSNNQLATKALDVQYPNRTTARANLDVGYANNTLAKSSLDVSYSLNAVFTSALDTRWNDLQVFAKNIDLLYANRALVTCALDIANPNNALFNSSIISRTPNNCVVLISQDFAWANRQLTTNLLDLPYATNQTFHRNLDVVYDLRQLVHKDVQFIWGINRKPSIV